jgi:hypothetical protein
MQFLPAGKRYNAQPECKICLKANLHFLHSGQTEIFAFRRECKIFIQAFLSAKTALLVSAKFARLQSAEFARDSIYYLKLLLFNNLKDGLFCLMDTDVQTAQDNIVHGCITIERDCHCDRPRD